MEELLINVLGNVPIAVTVLIVWFFISKGQNELEEQREKNRSSDEAARNKQIESLLSMQTQTAEALQSSNTNTLLMRQTLENNTDALTDMHESMETKFGDTIRILNPLAAHAKETAETVRDLPQTANETLSIVQAIQNRMASIETMLQTTMGAVQSLYDCNQTQDVTAGLAELRKHADQITDDLQSVRRDIRALVTAANIP